MKKLLGILCLVMWGIAPLPVGASTPHEPIIIIPGLGASFNWDILLKPNPTLEQIVETRDSWKYAPGVKEYDQLAQALNDAGLMEGKDYFIAYYDWRKSNAESATNYLIPIIDTALIHSETGKVDIIAHSMGGLVARSYIQSDAYRNDVSQLIMLGTPNHGSPDAYALWQAGEVPTDWEKSVRHAIEFYLWYMTKVTKNTKDAYDTIHTLTPSIKEVLPTYNYLVNSADDEVVPESGMHERNNFLAALNLSENVKKMRPRVPGKVSTIVGRDVATVATVPVEPRKAEDGKFWVDGKPNPMPPARNDTGGDGRVMVQSALLDDFSPIFSDSPTLWERISRSLIPTAEAFGFFFDQNIISARHGALPTEAIKDIFTKLSLEMPGKTYLAQPEPTEVAAFWIASPVDIVIKDPEGRTVSSTTNAIPGAVYESESDPSGVKIITIENPLRGTYVADLVGVETGAYHFAAAFFTSSDESIKTIEDSVALNERIRYAVALTPGTSVPVEITPVDPSEETPPSPLALLSLLLTDVTKARDEGQIPPAFAKRLIAPLQSTQSTLVKIQELPENSSKTRSEQTLLRFSIFQVNLFLALMQQNSTAVIPEEVSKALIERGQHIVKLLSQALVGSPPPASPFI